MNCEEYVVSRLLIAEDKLEKLKKLKGFIKIEKTGELYSIYINDIFATTFIRQDYEKFKDFIELVDMINE